MNIKQIREEIHAVKLHPVQEAVLDKFGFWHQCNKLHEEMKELHIEITWGVLSQEPNPNEKFYREFLDVRNLMQQIESRLDQTLLNQYEAEMFEKIKTKYLDV